MELISRTMQDMQTHDTDYFSENSISDLSTMTAPPPTTTNINKYRRKNNRIY